MRRTAATAAVALALLLSAAVPMAAEPLRVLLLGNSYTASFGGLGGIAEAFGEARGIELETEQVAPGGFTLEAHFADLEDSRTLLAAGGWDAVVLQEQSLRPVADRAVFERFGRLLAAEAVSAGARPVFLMTWAWRERPADQPLLASAYCGLATDTGAAVAPAGLAWQLALSRRPDLPLHHADGSHPNARGTYLAALVLYATLTGDSPLGLPASPVPGVSLPADEAAFLQQTAADTLAGEGEGPGTGACAFAPEDALVLTGGRFTVEAAYQDPLGGHGPAVPVPIAPDTGAFWFFTPNNLELMVKVLDARAVNGHFWVFYGALSNVAYTVTVTDRETGRQRIYDNPQGSLASRADVAAFPGG